MKIVQVKLYSEKRVQHEALTTWVNVRADLSEGAIIELKDFKPKQRWVVHTIYPGEHDADDFEFHRKWDNNNYDKHKGLKI